jgi:hypothetical protein
MATTVGAALRREGRVEGSMILKSAVETTDFTDEHG